MKKIVFSLVAFSLFSCAEMQQVMDQLPQGTVGLSQIDIANGLKEALDNGIEKQVSETAAAGKNLIDADVKVASSNVSTVTKQVNTGKALQNNNGLFK